MHDIKTQHTVIVITDTLSVIQCNSSAINLTFYKDDNAQFLITFMQTSTFNYMFIIQVIIKGGSCDIERCLKVHYVTFTF